MQICILWKKEKQAAVEVEEEEQRESSARQAASHTDIHDGWHQNSKVVRKRNHPPGVSRRRSLQFEPLPWRNDTSNWFDAGVPLLTIPLLLAKHLFPLPPTQPVFCGGDFHKSVTSAIAWAFLIDSISFGKGREVGQPQWSALFPFFFACSAFALSCIPYKLRRERRCGLRKKSFFHLRVNCPRMNTTAPRDGPPCRSLYCRDGAAFDIRLCSKLFS